jgi:hypothetical protein
MATYEGRRPQRPGRVQLKSGARARTAQAAARLLLTPEPLGLGGQLTTQVWAVH